jgi:predicted DNA-binding transcriptional regulator AlpA
MPIRNNPRRARALAAAARQAKSKELPQTPKSTARGRLLPKAEMLALVGVSYTTVWKLMREGKFPRGVFVGERLGWFEAEIAAWAASLRRQRLKGDDASEAA